MWKIFVDVYIYRICYKVEEIQMKHIAEYFWRVLFLMDVIHYLKISKYCIIQLSISAVLGEVGCNNLVIHFILLHHRPCEEIIAIKYKV